MKRIYLLIDDYTELTFLETLLKKVGFDAFGYQGVLNASDKALEILPDLVILSDQIRHQSTSEALDQIKKIRPQVKCLLLRRDFNTTLKHNLKFIDLTLKSPIDPIDFLKHITNILDIDSALVTEKFVKLGLFKGKDVESYIKVSGTENKNQTIPVFLKKIESMSKDKESQYQEALSHIPKPLSQFIDPKRASSEASDFRNREGDVEIKNIDKERQNFVKALFKK